jgi:DNA polymerase-4
VSVTRRIIHVDMDAFYASVEQRDRPELRGKPVIVGGLPSERAVVCTASYEARRFGVKSAMPVAKALHLCPSATLLRPDFERYSAVSENIHEIFRRHTPLVEPLSLDEAFLDVSAVVSDGGATAIARAIKDAIRQELDLTASAGVAPNKFLAKVASDLEKPNGLTVIRPEAAEAFALTLDVRKIPGIGPKTEELCHRYGIRQARDFLRYEPQALQHIFGRFGAELHDLARGIDPRPVTAERERVSIGIEDTFPRDITGLAPCRAKLAALATRLEERMAEASAAGSTITLKVKYGDFTRITRSRTLPEPVATAAPILATLELLLAGTDVSTRSVRLVGIQVSRLADQSSTQLHLPFTPE